MFATINSNNNKRGMAMNGKRALAILAMAAALVAGPAAAQGRDETGLYLGGSVGYSQYNEVCERSNVPCDDTDDAVRLFVGYQFNRNWSVELGFGDFGDATGQGALAGGGTGSFEWSSYAWDVTGLGHIGIAGGLSVFGRLGLYMGRTTVDQEATGFASTHDAKTNSGFTYGAGVAYTLGRFGIRAEWQRYDNIGTNSLGTDEVDIFSVGGLFRF